MNYLIELLNNEYNKEDVSDIIDAYNSNRYSSFRVNSLKSNKDEIIKILDCNNIKYEFANWYKDAFVISRDDEIKVKELDIYLNGLIYFQSLSSMLPPIILDPKANESILDMCAAPGSKTSEISALSNDRVLLTACERHKDRFERLKYNLSHLNVNKCVVMNIDSKDLNEYMKFDKILLDAPCSGTGTITTINKDKFKLDKIILDKVTNMQLNLLNKSIKLLNKDNFILYSTCSILKEENEDIINKILKEGNVKVVPIKLDDSIELLKSNIDGVVTVKPNKYYEGFFMCLLKKIK